ncbi:hypothetical protein K438DRAFT_1753548 [Mycena galopus ATCC 62051]|nr:hypothetical protein K438DRAFT_1753548 [Mycena galopus ATCC 62051]
MPRIHWEKFVPSWRMIVGVDVLCAVIQRGSTASRALVVSAPDLLGVRPGDSVILGSSCPIPFSEKQAREDKTLIGATKIRVLREAELTEEERNAGALCRNRKRQRLENSPPTSPPKQESEDHDEMLRSTAQEARHAISDLYGPFGFLNSQVGESTYIDHILNVPIDLGPKSEPQSQEVRFLDPPQDPESDNDSDHELPDQVVRLKNWLNIALQVRDDLEDQCNQYQQAYIQADVERSQLREELQKWEQAATAASALTKMLDPYSS